jgi:hypothetical protein
MATRVGSSGFDEDRRANEHLADEVESRRLWRRYVAALSAARNSVHDASPIYNTDLTSLTKSDVDEGVKTAARSSIWRFAWDMRGGDVIYVGDSVSKSIVARGYITTGAGERAYRYNDRDPMTEPSNPAVPWRHEVPVRWDNDFVPFTYIDGAPRITVMHFDPAWAEETEDQALVSAQTQGDIEPQHDALLNELAYMRDTPASQKNVLRLHAALSNRFRSWLEKGFGVKAVQEKRRIDLRFSYQGMGHLAELKICYGENTRHAIREALGQILEYNHYPAYEEMQSWWLVLDCKPTAEDRHFITTLKERYRLPLSLTWPMGEHFEAFPRFPLPQS